MDNENDEPTPRLLELDEEQPRVVRKEEPEEGEGDAASEEKPAPTEAPSAGGSSTRQALSDTSASEADEFDDDEDEENKPGPRRPEPPQRRQPPRNAKELLMEVAHERGLHADQKLRGQLMGSIMVELYGSGDRYLFDWNSDSLRTSELGPPKSGAVPPVPPDCTIKVSEQNLLRVANGDLNPQIAMLSEKIAVLGRAGLAIYFFNLIAPRVGI